MTTMGLIERPKVKARLTKPRSGKPKPAIKEKVIVKDRRFYGCIWQLTDGRRIYIAERREDQHSRNKHKTLTDALDKGELGWALDRETLYRLRAERIRIVIVKTKDTGAMWITDLERFFDDPLSSRWDYTEHFGRLGRGGTDQRQLFLGAFQRGDGRIWTKR